MVATIVTVIAVLIAGILVYAATKPGSFRYQRSTTIDAPPERIYPFINDFHRWEIWSPYEKLDADLKKTYSGPPSGEGAVYEWEGKKAGVGRMEIMDTTPDSRVKIDLRFVKPFKAHNTAEFVLEPVGDATKVTWGIFGATPYASKLMSVFVDMDKMIGKDFETGLASLKAVSERQAQGAIG